MHNRNIVAKQCKSRENKAHMTDQRLINPYYIKNN